MRRSYFLFLAVLAGLMACGHDPAPFAAAPAALRFATAENLANDDVVPHSYLVAFRDDAGDATIGSSILALQGSLQSFFRGKPAVDSHRAIARMNLTFPGRSFDEGRSLVHA